MPYCDVCGNKAQSNRCFRHKERKAIEQSGKGRKKWSLFRDTVAIPYLDQKGRFCACCGRGGYGARLDVDHILNRGSHPHLAYEVSNLQYLCRECHVNKTNRRECKHFDIM